MLYCHLSKTVTFHNWLCFVHRTGADSYKKCYGRATANALFPRLSFERGRVGLEERICHIGH